MRAPRLKCTFCGTTSTAGYMERVGRTWQCKNDIACFNRVLYLFRYSQDYAERLKRAGSQMANVCFNLSQLDGIVSADQRATMAELCKDWDSLK